MIHLNLRKKSRRKAKSTDKNIGLKIANLVTEYESKTKELNPHVEILIPLAQE